MNYYQVIIFDKKNKARIIHEVLAVNAENAKGAVLYKLNDVDILSVVKLFPVYNVGSFIERQTQWTNC